ncbi:hypothetical protein BG004_007343 [Podila humilis]|nr:hypothetical protein BG004_007343 [Podila humilis]
MAHPIHSSLRDTPPVLSFRAFHAAHFSAAAKSSFFAASSLLSPAPHWQHPPWFMNGSSHEYQRLNGAEAAPQEHAPLYAVLASSAHDAPARDEADPQGSFNNITINGNVEETENECGGGLSKETIAILEFSRKFRQEKAAAARLEQERDMKRRFKRKKLTRLGFAYNEGDSAGSDKGEDGEDEAALQSTDVMSSTVQPVASATAENPDEQDDDEDEEPSGQELSATDVTFMTQNNRQRSNPRSKLYRSSAASSDSDKNLGTNCKTAVGMATIDSLEALLNHHYTVSLSEGSAVLETEPTGRKRRLVSQGPTQYQQVVYWPGMPLRC